MFHDVRPTKRLPCREILEPANSPPFRWRHSGGLLDSTMWSTSRSSALRPGSLMNWKLWVVGPESWKDLNFCHYPGRGSGVQVMLLRLFFAKRGEALSESYPQIVIMITVLFSAYHHFDTNKIPFFGYADVHVHRTYTECTVETFAGSTWVEAGGPPQCTTRRPMKIMKFSLWKSRCFGPFGSQCLKLGDV